MSTRPLNIHAALLAGGRSTRMGCDKRFLDVKGAFALDGAFQLLQSWTSTYKGKVVICGAVDGYACLNDNSPGKGPLAGLESAILKFLDISTGADPSWLLVVPVDMPKLSKEVFDALISPVMHDHAIRENIQVLRFKGHELPAIYKVTIKLKKILLALLSHSDARERSYRNLLKQLQGIEIPVSPNISACLENVNTPEDWARVRKTL